MPTLSPDDHALPGGARTIAAALACVVATSCILSGYDKLEDDGSGGAGGTGPATVVTSGGDGGAGGGDGGGETLPRCDTTDLPAPPGTAEPGEVPDQYFALRAVRFGDPADRSTVPGFDLDRADGCRSDCSGEDECGLPEYLPELDIDERVQRCDFVDGIDNSGVHLFEQLAEYVGSDDVSLSQQAEEGAWSFIVRVRGWNGLPDDATVELALFATPGFGWTADGEGGAGGAPPVVPPTWNGTDVWPVDARSLDPEAPSLEAPAFADSNAYVSGGQLVGSLGGTFYAGTNQLPIELAAGILVAPLPALDAVDRHVENGIFAGRWPVQDLIDSVGALQVNGTALCNLGPIFETVVEDVCKLLDVTDDTLPGACDAMSFAFEFDAWPVGVPAPIVNPDVAPVGCAQVTSCETVFGGG